MGVEEVEIFVQYLCSICIQYLCSICVVVVYSICAVLVCNIGFGEANWRPQVANIQIPVPASSLLQCLPAAYSISEYTFLFHRNKILIGKLDGWYE